MPINAPAKRSIFVSYHHGGDRSHYDAFSRLFTARYELIYDNSVEREIDSDDPEYVIRKIREEYITGSSCTIVLCGAQTSWRKFVDWEIKATLDKEHGLIGVNLPSISTLPDGKFVVPDRLYDNIQSGYAVYTTWEDLTTDSNRLPTLIELASNRRKQLIQNHRELRTRNG
jgi:hypothetical protein